MNSYGTPSIAIRAIKPISSMKIAWVSPLDIQAAQTRIRVFNVHNCLKSMGYLTYITNDYQEVINKGCSIVIVGKCFDENNYNNIKLLKQLGKTVLCDLCEDIVNWPWVNEILSVCDKVICCSYKLEEKVKTVNSKTIVIEDAFET
jgi:hypothetical protein